MAKKRRKHNPAVAMAYARGVKKGRQDGWDLAMAYRDKQEEEIAGIIREALPPGDVEPENPYDDPATPLPVMDVVDAEIIREVTTSDVEAMGRQLFQRSRFTTTPTFN